jgi:IS30 family transposase
MTHRILLFLLCASLATSPALAQDDVMEKIKRLEQQIQELKALKAQQNISVAKAEQCMKVVARERFCTCVGNNLPLDISFEQYVHTLVTSKEALGYAGMTQEQKAVIDATLDVREKCIEKGFFK